MYPATPSNPTAIVIPDPVWPDAYVVLWAGRVHGGQHWRYDGAEAHAARLNAVDVAEYSEWLDMQGFGTLLAEVK